MAREASRDEPCLSQLPISSVSRSRMHAHKMRKYSKERVD